MLNFVAVIRKAYLLRPHIVTYWQVQNRQMLDDFGDPEKILSTLENTTINATENYMVGHSKSPLLAGETRIFPLK